MSRAAPGGAAIKDRAEASGTVEQRIRFCAGAEGRPIAYAVTGSGPPLVCAAWWVSHLEHDWANPRFRAFFEALGRDHTVYRYDRTGVGLSDRVRTAFSLDSELADLEAVAAQVGPGPLALLTQSAGGPVATTFAARHPDRVSRLVLYGTYASGATLTRPELQEAMPALVRASWGLGSKMMVDLFAPGCAPDEARALASFQRVACSAEMASRLLALTYQLDATDAARQVRVPTLVLHRRGDRVMPFEAGRRLAALIPGAELVVLEGDIHIPWLGDADAVLAAILRFLTGASPAAATSPRAPIEPAGTPDAEFVCRGDVWEIRFAARTVHVKHAKGLADLAHLLAHPGEHVEAVALAYADADAVEDLRHAGADPVLDARALASYQRRLEELDAALGDATRNQDLGSRERLVAERDALLSELDRSTRPGGASRRLNDPRERARKAVSARIRQSIDVLRGVHPELAEHLDRSVTTGSSCRYAPPAPVRWRC